MLASDANNPHFLGATNPDLALHVEFHYQPVFNAWASKEQKQKIWENHVYVRITTPGNNLNVIDVPARDEHKARFPLQWAHFQNMNGQGSAQQGTPITEWALLNPAQVEMLRAQKFYTVEMVAFASDEQIQHVGMAAGMSPYAFREKAKAYLGAQKKDAEDDALRSQLEEERRARQALEERLARLEAGNAPEPQAEPAKELKAGTPEAESVMELSQLRMSYEALAKKKPDARWGAERLRTEMENLAKECTTL